MIKENVNGFNMLVTNGDEKYISTKDKCCSHLWIHNNILNKNHTSLKYDVGRFMTESEIIFIKDKKLPISDVSDGDYQEVKTDNSDDNFILKLDYQGAKLLKQALSRTMARGEVLDFSMKLEDDLYKYITDFEKR